MKHLIINTLPPGHAQGAAALEELCGLLEEPQVRHTREMNLTHCLGCNSCWLRTPGVCPIKDDYQELLTGFLEAEAVVFITEAKLGFVSHRMKNLMDRILPLDTMYLKFYKGQMRHLPRYDKTPRMGLLYAGEGDREYLNAWMERAMLNLHGVSLGAYQISEGRELCLALNHRQLHAQSR